MIQFKEVNITFNQGTAMEHQVLNQFNLEIPKGAFLAIVGGNGAGKTTLMKALTGDIWLSKGSLYIDDLDITHLPKHIRAKQIAYISQDPLLGTFAELTVEENLMLASKRGNKRNLLPALNQNKKEALIELLKLLDLNLENKLKCKMGLLSGGQRQAICLIMAFMREAKVILLDEHTAALDPKASHQIMQLTAKWIKEKGLTAIMITHALSHAVDYASKIIVMHQGRIKKAYQRGANFVTIANLHQDLM